MGYDFDSTVRHELGHTLTTTQSLQELRATPYGTAWAAKHLSEYTGTSEKELLAEALSLYTAPTYQTGALPSLLETIIGRMLGLP